MGFGMKDVFRIAVLFFVTVALAQQPLPTNTQSPFLAIPVATPDALRFGGLLPDFEAKDINGRTLGLEELRGKFTLVYLWDVYEARATDAFDPHARAIIRGDLPDLPEVQRFHEKARNAANFQVLTFCRDYDNLRARDYMNEKKFNFPVITDWVLVNKLIPAGGLHLRYWLVNPECRLSSPLRSWSFGQVLFQTERAAARN